MTDYRADNERLKKMYSGWLGLEGKLICGAVAQEDLSRSVGMAENTRDRMGTVYYNHAIFTFP